MKIVMSIFSIKKEQKMLKKDEFGLTFGRNWTNLWCQINA
jgi:hypothetical protein